VVNVRLSLSLKRSPLHWSKLGKLILLLLLLYCCCSFGRPFCVSHNLLKQSPSQVEADPAIDGVALVNVTTRTGQLPAAERSQSSSNPPEVPSEGASAGNVSVTLDALQRAIAGTANLANATSSHALTPTLSDLLHPDVIGPALDHPSMVAVLPSLLKRLPEQDQESLENLRQVLLCLPLRSQAAALTNALASGSAAELLASFSIPPDHASSAGAIGEAGVRAFLRALRNLAMRRDPNT
jgi:hypothetical protein